MTTTFAVASASASTLQFGTQPGNGTADAAIPTRWATLKGELSVVRSPDAQSDEYMLSVVQAERQTGEWSLLAGYAADEELRSRVELYVAAQWLRLAVEAFRRRITDWPSCMEELLVKVEAKLPANAERSLEDPYAEPPSPWKARLILCALIAVGYGWSIGKLFP